jgi:hypothetical protein
MGIRGIHGTQLKRSQLAIHLGGHQEEQRQLRVARLPLGKERRQRAIILLLGLQLLVP